MTKDNRLTTNCGKLPDNSQDALDSNTKVKDLDAKRVGYNSNLQHPDTHSQEKSVGKLQPELAENAVSSSRKTPDTQSLSKNDKKLFENVKLASKVAIAEDIDLLKALAESDNKTDTQSLSSKEFKIGDNRFGIYKEDDVRLAVQEFKKNIVYRFNNDANVVMNWEFILNEEIDKIFGSKLC